LTRRESTPSSQKIAAAHDEIQHLPDELDTLKEQSEGTASHQDLKNSQQEQRFRRLSTHSKLLLDALKR
jgi:hypothetical protein